MKICGKCELELPLTEYWKKAENPDGLQRYCKECMRTFQKAYRTRNKERDFIPLVENKLCGSCYRTLPADSFYLKRDQKDGLCDWCKDCRRKQVRDGYKHRR